MMIPALIFLLTTLEFQVQGIEFQIARNYSVQVYGLTSCGTIRCIKVNPVENVSIKSLVVLKQHNGGEHVLANLSKVESSTSRFNDGVMVNGTLTSSKADVQLILFNSQDCIEARFICEVIMLDTFGTELRSSSAGIIKGQYRHSETSSHKTRSVDMQDLASQNGVSYGGNAALASALQLSAIIQQTQAYLAGRIEHVQDSVSERIFEVGNTLAVLEKSLTNSFQHRNKNAEHSGCSKHNGTVDNSLINALRRQIASMEANVTQANKETVANVSTLIAPLYRMGDRVERILNESKNDMINKFETTFSALKQGNIETTKEMPTVCSRDQTSPQMEKYQVIRPTDGSPLFLCDTDGGWTVIQRRINGHTDFYRDWNTYKQGFGAFDGDFWLGLDHIHHLTANGSQELKITLLYQGRSAYALYTNFYIAGENENYKIYFGTYTGTAGDALRRQENMSFSTFDRDNDKYASSCAQMYLGAWWYNECHDSNLNGRWGAGAYKGPRWGTFTDKNPVTMSEMKIRKMI